MMETDGKVESVPPPESVFTKMASMGSGKFKVKSKVKDPVNVFKIESEVCNKTDAREASVKASNDEETITEVDDKMVKMMTS